MTNAGIYTEVYIFEASIIQVDAWQFSRPGWPRLTQKCAKPKLTLRGPQPPRASTVTHTWTLRRQNFLPKGPGGRNFRRKAQKTPPARKNAETQQTLRHAETCFREIPPISRRFPAEFRRFPAACFAQNLILKKTLPGKLKTPPTAKRRLFPKRQKLLPIWVVQVCICSTNIAIDNMFTYIPEQVCIK